MHSCHSFVFDPATRTNDESLPYPSPTPDFEYTPFKRNGIRKDRDSYDTSVVRALKAHVLRLKRSIRAFDEEREILKEYTVSVLLDNERVEKDLSILRSHYRDELGQAKQTRLQLQHAQAELTRLNHRFAETERFILALLDLGLELPVLREAVSSVLKDEQSGEDALINASRKTAVGRDRTWSNPDSMSSPRAVDHYLSALELTLSARKELKEKAKVAEFWKTVAKSDPANADTVTPSTSDLDQLQNSCSPTRRSSKTSIIDDFVFRLKDTLLAKQAGHIDSGIRTLDSEDPSPPYDSSNETPFLSLSAAHHAIGPSPLDTPSQKHYPKLVSQAGLKNTSNIPRKSPAKEQSFRLPRAAAYSAREPGLDAETLLHTNMQSLSGAAKRLSDPNLPLKIIPQANEPSTLKPNPPRGNALTSNVSFSSSMRNSLHRSPSTPRHSKRMSYPFSTPSSIASRNKKMGSIFGTTSVSATDTFRACQALLSLERICASFGSSSSLGSLAHSSEEKNADAGPQAWFTDTNSTPSSAAQDTDSCASSIARPPSNVIGDYPKSSSNTLKMNEDLPHVASNIDAENEDQNTTSPPAPPSQQRVVKKKVKWALPLSPERDRSNSITSVTSIATTSSSETASNSSKSTSRSVARPFRYGKARPRSSSSPTPTPAISTLTTTKFSSTGTKQSLLKSSRILKTKPVAPIAPPTKLSQSQKSRPRSTPAGPLLSLNPSTLPTGSRFQSASNRPNLPPRSPLRPKTSSSTSPFGSPILDGSQPQEVRVVVPQGAGTGRKEDAPTKITSLPQCSPSANMQVYDYTKPIMPLKVTKKSLPLPKKPVAISPPRIRAFASHSTITREDSFRAFFPNSSTPPSRQRPGPRPSPINLNRSRSTEGSARPQDTSSDDSADLFDALNASSDSNDSSTSQSSVAEMAIKPRPVVLTVSEDGRPKSLSPGHVVPPMRSSSLMPSKTSQSPLRRPQLGPLQPLRLHGIQQPPESEKPPPPRKPSAAGTQQFIPPKLKGSKSEMGTSNTHSPMISSPPTPASQPKKTPRMSTPATSPLAKLRVSVLPPSSLVRSMSKSMQRTRGSGVGELFYSSPPK